MDPKEYQAARERLAREAEEFRRHLCAPTTIKPFIERFAGVPNLGCLIPERDFERLLGFVSGKDDWIGRARHGALDYLGVHNWKSLLFRYCAHQLILERQKLGLDNTIVIDSQVRTTHAVLVAFEDEQIEQARVSEWFEQHHLQAAGGIQWDLRGLCPWSQLINVIQLGDKRLRESRDHVWPRHVLFLALPVATN